jgi:hypothetical protein
MNSFKLATVKNTMLIYVHSFRLCQPLLSVESQKMCFSRTGFVYVKNWRDSENSSISQLCFLFVIYLRFIITLVKGMFDLQINKKKKKCFKWIKTTAHSQNILHVDVLYNIKRKKYKTVCAELAFAKSPSTEWSWICIELVFCFLYLLCSWIIAIFKGCLIKSRRRENFWGISYEKSRFYAKQIIFFPILGGRARRVHPHPPTPLDPPLYIDIK